MSRLTVEDASGFSFGSGTMVDTRDGNVLIVTCGHIFRDSQGKGKITVDVFGSSPQPKLVGYLVGFDLKRDIGLVSIQPTAPVTTIPVATPDYQVSVGDRVVSVGCDNGANPSVRESKVNSRDKFLGPANLQVAGLPVQGRSGGGLFSSNGLLIGVCNAADPADNEGLFAAANTIHAQLDQAGLASVYQRAGGAANTALAANPTPLMPAQMPPANLTGASSAAAIARGNIANAAAALEQLSPGERATLAELRQKSQGAEVILHCPLAHRSQGQERDHCARPGLDRVSEFTLRRTPHPGCPASDVTRRAPQRRPRQLRIKNWQPNWRSNP